MKRIEVIGSTCVVDERGTITSFLPADPIVEYNLVTLRAGGVRGLHWHPHFTEYLLFIDGEGWLDSRDIDAEGTSRLAVSRGVSTRAVPGVAHAVHAISDLTFVAMLTRPWHESDPPIVRFAL